LHNPFRDNHTEISKAKEKLSFTTLELLGGQGSGRGITDKAGAMKSLFGSHRTSKGVCMGEYLQKLWKYTN
jgi:hypothetical protein